jgi:hypothetical protein
VSARVDAAGARRRIGELFRRRFELPEDPWSSGAPCAFDAASRAALEELAKAANEGEFQARIALVLAR